MASVDYLAICDPVAVQEFGHNLAALSRYSKHLAEHCAHLDIFAGSSLAQCDINASDFTGNLIWHYTHYYSRIIQVPSSRLDPIGSELLNLSNQAAHAAAKQAAITDLREILNRASQHKTSILYFPSVDYYSLLALACLQDEVKSSQAKVLLRFIGVMENICHHKQAGEELHALLARLANASRDASRSPYSFSAESPVLAQRLRAQFGLDIAVTPTLVDEEQLPPIESETFAFCFPGSARIDKGFDKILNILNAIDQAYPFLDYQVYLQALPSSELIHHYNIQRDLFKHPRVRAYPATVSQSALKSYIQKSHIIVLPYCPRTYEERSSAMMAEAACYGRQVVASSDCGFSSQIEELGIGFTCNDAAEIAKAIANYSLLGTNTLTSMSKSARANYQAYASDSYHKFFSLPQ